MDPNADNYNSNATVDDGSCIVGVNTGGPTLDDDDDDDDSLSYG